MTNESKHTPGPWEAGECGLPDEPGIFADGLLVAKVPVPLNLSRKEAEANARLIAAAPDMLDACNRALNLIANVEGLLQDHDAWGDTEQDILEAVQAAIAKAKGR